MSKAVAGAAILGGSLVTGAVAFALASTGVGLVALPALMDAANALAVAGVAMEAGAIASALTSNRGMEITTRQPAAQRQVIYGPQRVGGIMIYESATGSTNRQYNRVIVLAGHQIAGIEALYLDGRRVWFPNGATGQETYNGFTFGGAADGNTYTGPSGQRYNFGGLVYCQEYDGAQTNQFDFISGIKNPGGGFCTALQANDPNWGPTSDGIPYVGGCAYVYLKLEYDQATFPQDPEVKFTVHGKYCWDPRINALVPGCSNPALIAADILTDPVFGLGEDWDAVYSGAAGEQLIAAANVCDEQVACAQGTEAQYACGLHYDSATGAGDALVQVMDAMDGRLSRVGGQWLIFPAYWQGPSFSFDNSILTAEPTWTPTRTFKELNNRVRGTFTCPNFPYNVEGNAYDANGFDAFGNQQNNFSFAWQPTSFPQYAVDPQHGYAADEYLNEDSGVQAAYDPTVTYAAGTVVSYITTIGSSHYCTCWRSVAGGNLGNTPGRSSTFWTLASVPLVQTLALPAVLSISQAQRLAKIRLLRNRQQGMGQMEMRISALGMQPCDVMQFTFPERGWADKMLEIVGVSPFRIVAGNDGEPPSIRATFKVQETDPSVYEWDAATEELSIYDVPALPATSSFVVAPPTDMSVICSAATAVTAVDGSVQPRAEITWNTPADATATQIQSQYRLTGSSTWITGPTVSVALNSLYIGGIVAGQQYDFQIRTLRPNGASSVWVQVLGVTAGLTVGVYTQLGLDPAALTSTGYSTGFASIEVFPFSARIGSLSIAILPSGPVILTLDGTSGIASGTQIAQQVLYYVYYVDPNLTGGAITPIATTNPADFLGKNGYFCIGSIVTAYQGSSSAPAPLRPSTWSNGYRTIQNPTAAFDGNFGTYATVQTPVGASVPSGSSPVQFGTWSGFPAVLSTAGQQLYVDLAANVPSSYVAGVSITANIAGTATGIASFTANTAQGLYSVALPTGTDLSQISVTVTTNFGGVRSGHLMPIGFSFGVSAQVYEIYVQ